MKNSVLVFLLFLGCFSIAAGQITIKGKVLEYHNNNSIPYVNIGVLNTNFGTISNSDGSFSITIPESYINDFLLFSAIGYQKQSIDLSTISDTGELLIYLKEKAINLDEVLIETTSKQKKLKKSWLGNPKRNLMVQGTMQVDSASAGGAMALLIDNPQHHELTFINEARLFISRNTEGPFKVRVRFLEVDPKTNLPGDDIVNESIVLTTDIKRGWLEFPLSCYQIELNQPSFFLVFEWILEEKDRLNLFKKFNDFIESNPDKIKRDSIILDGKKVASNSISSSAPIPMIIFGTSKTKTALKNYICYSRKSSFAPWQRAHGILSAKVLMSNSPLANPILEELSAESSNNKEAALNSKIEEWSTAFMEAYNLPGMQLSLSIKDSLVFSRGFGYSDLEEKKEVSRQTRFRIASVTKPMTSAMIIKLASEGKMSLDADVRTYVPSFPEKKYSVTIRQLAGHLGGIRDYHELSIDEVIGNPHFENATDAIKLFKNDTLISKPGTAFLYSSFGYNLLGAAIEGATKQTYLKSMEENFWRPLQMASTYGDIKDSTMVFKSKFYYPNEEEAKPYDLSYAHASGGLISTTEDLLKFGNELLYGRFLDDDSKQQVFTTQYTSDNNPTNYGLGWYLKKDLNNHKIIYHVGQSPSSGGLLLLNPKQGIVMAILSNTPILVNSEDGLPPEVLELTNMIYQ